MKRVASIFVFVALLSAAIALPPPSTLALQGETRFVTSTVDSGPGTLRQVMEQAQSGDTITFDPTVFPPTAPVTISITSDLPGFPGNLTIDASDAGVILDGSNMLGEWVGGLQIVSSDGNRIQGLQISNFSGRAIDISGDSQNNVIGGDRSLGAGPFGQGNQLIQNGTGVVLSTDGTSDNTITGNLIGTDAASVQGLGNNTGIWITEGANGNIIGPDNVIANNWEAGINVQELGSLHNTITQNSIHDNGWLGIAVGWDTFIELAAPTLFDFDLQAGAVTGTTCYSCIIEIFSDSEDQGEHFEGQATADSRGAFTFNKGAPFMGPHLTATATGRDGSTSEFSLPTLGAARSLTLQEGNGLTATHLQHRHSGELPDNRVGYRSVGQWSPDHFDQFLYNFGLKRSRVAFNNQEPPVEWDIPEFEIRPEWDAMVTRLADNGFKMKYYLTFWDKETYPDGEGAPCPRFKTEGEIERYLAYVRFIVNHFKDRIEYYELWNEPDIQHSCPQAIELADYINLVQRTVPVIRDEYPEAKISIGAVSGIRYSDAHEYLLGILESNIMPLVDAVSWHPFYGESPEHEEVRDYYYAYPSIAQNIKDTASAHGFDGEYQVDELSWWTPNPGGENDPLAVSPTAAAKYASRSIIMHLGMDITTTVNRGTGYALRNLSTIMAGSLPAVLPMQIQTTATDMISYTFALSNDDYLVALWTDGIAAEYDPGLTTTVTIHGITDYTVMGIDVLHGFEQPINSSEEGGDLVIRDLLVKDYPTILRLNATRYVFLPIASKIDPD